MDRDAAFHMLDFVENIKDKISTNEYKEILEYISKKYNTKVHRELYNVLYTTFELITIKDGEDKNINFKKYIKEECLVRLTNEEYEIIFNLVNNERDSYEKEDIINMYKIMYINNSIGNFNFKKNLLTPNFIFNDEEKIVNDIDIKIQCPIILSIYKPKNIENDVYSFEIDYIYSKERIIQRDITRENVNDINEYKKYWLTMCITCDLSIDEYKYIIENIFSSSIKLLYDNKKDIKFKRYNFETMKKSSDEDEFIRNILFEDESNIPYVIYNEEKYYINTISYSENIIIEYNGSPF